MSKADKGLSTVDPKPKDVMDDYEALNHYDTLMRAHEIMGDEDKMGRVREIAGRKAKSATGFHEMVSTKPKKKPGSIAELKALAKDMRTKKKAEV